MYMFLMENIGSTQTYLHVMNPLIVVLKDMSALLSVLLSDTAVLRLAAFVLAFSRKLHGAYDTVILQTRRSHARD
jgi:hypothetical protein